MTTNKETTYLQLYLQAMYTGLFFVGSGAFVAVTHRRYVEELGWISEEEMLDFYAIAAAVPGGAICNFFAMLGYKMAGVLGSVLTYLGIITAPIVFITIISFCYDAFAGNIIVQTFLQGMVAATCAIIVNTVIDISNTIARSSGWKVFSITALAFALNFFLNISIGWIILSGVAVAVITTIVKFSMRKKEGASK